MSGFTATVAPTNEIIAKHFKTYRLALNLTQKSLAALMGMAEGTISKNEQYGRRIDVGEFLRYCAALDINPVEFTKAIMGADDVPLNTVRLTAAQATQGLNEANQKLDFKMNTKIIGGLTGEHLKTVRLKCKLTMRKVAQRLGAPHSLIGKIEAFDRSLDIGELIHYCTGMNKKAFEVLSDVIVLVNADGTVKG